MLATSWYHHVGHIDILSTSVGDEIEQSRPVLVTIQSSIIPPELFVITDSVPDQILNINNKI